MEGREGIATSISGLSAYYIHQQGYGRGESAAGMLPGIHRSLPAIRQHADSSPYQHNESALHPHHDSSNPAHHDSSIHPHHSSSLRDLAPGPALQPSQIGFSFQVETPSLAPSHSVGDSTPAVTGENKPIKKKRGRPRKYKPDGAVMLGLSPSSSSSNPALTSGLSSGVITTANSGSLTASASGSGPASEKRRGRPPGSGKIQQLASLGECFIGSVGTGFTPHIIIVPSGEDIAARIMSFSHQGPRAVFILSAYGAVSSATLRQTATSATSAIYEGRFEIICLSGSYLLLDDGNSKNRTGGLSVCLCGPDGRVVGGNVGGELKASGMVQVIVGSFMYSGPKGKSKVKAEETANGGSELHADNREEAPTQMAVEDSFAHEHVASTDGWGLAQLAGY